MGGRNNDLPERSNSLGRGALYEVVEGAIIRRSERLHWTNEAAKEEVLGWMRESAQPGSTDEIEWQSAEDVTIGRFANDPNHVAVIRSMLLPLGKPPRMR